MRPCDALALPIAAVYGSLVYFLVEYAEILVPLSQLMALFAYALARYRGDTYPTLLLSTITCGLVTVISVLAIIASILPVAMPIYLFTEEGIVQDCIMLGAIGAIEIILSLLLFRIKRFRAGITPEKDGNVELMVLAAAACIFLNTLFSMGSPRAVARGTDYDIHSILRSGADNMVAETHNRQVQAGRLQAQRGSRSAAD